jgi:UDP-4-amino-4,6-dideoxy-N-acetyl-beta-L-altrosamine transaminase
MKKYIPYGRQDISSEDIKSVEDILKSDFLTQGQAVPEFEKALNNLCKSKFSTVMSSATAALHIACKALELGPGDIMWTSPISFVASANCALYCGAKVDFVDIDPLSNNMSIKALEEKLIHAESLNALPKVVIPVHLAGLSADMAAISSLSKKYNFKIIEDASHAIGGTYNGEPIGNCIYSDICIFSFHPVKIIAAGEGGALLTNDPEIFNKANLYRSHGITKEPDQFKYNNPGEWYYEQHLLGFNYRMTDIQAALGLSQLSRIASFIEKRKKIVRRYHSKLKGLPICLPSKSYCDESSNHLFIIRIKNDISKLTHKKIFSKLRQENIGVNLHYIPIYRQPFYIDLMSIPPSDFPESEKYYQEAISLPIFFSLSNEELDYVCDVLAANL